MWNVKHAIEEGMLHMTRSFDPDRDDLPWFEIRLEREKPGYMFHYPDLDEPHAPGRCLDAMLYAEAVTGCPVPEEAVARFRKTLAYSLNAPDGFNGCWDETGRRRIIFHNFREGLLALNALVRWRGDEEARTWGDRLVSAIANLAQPDGSWDAVGLRALEREADVLCGDEPATTSGRLVYALLQWADTTGDTRAEELAGRFARHALASCFTPEGELSDKAGWHVHSLTSTLSSLADWFLRTGDREGLERVAQILDTGIKPWMSRSGWVKELRGPEQLGGEVNSTGDLVQACLCLAQGLGEDGYYARAEEMLRGHLLPSQVFPEDLPEAWKREDPAAGDRCRDISGRMRGGFGFPWPEERAPLHYEHPYCRITTLDITAGSVQALCRAYVEGAKVREDLVRLDLLLPRREPGLVVEQPSLREFVIRSVRPVEMRLPVHQGLTVDGQPVAARDRLCLRPGRHCLRFAFPLREETESLQGHPYRTAWVGEQAIAMEPRGKVSHLFARFDGLN